MGPLKRWLARVDAGPFGQAREKWTPKDRVVLWVWLALVAGGTFWLASIWPWTPSFPMMLVLGGGGACAINWAVMRRMQDAAADGAGRGDG